MTKMKVNSTDTWDLGKIWDKNKRYWWVFAVCLVGCLSLAALYLYKKAPVYAVTSSILVSQEDNGADVGASLVKNLSLGGASANVDDEVIVLSSTSLIKEMVKELGLNRTYYVKTGFMRKYDAYKETPITLNAPNEVFDTLSVGFSVKVKVNAEGNKIEVKAKKGLFKTLAEVTAEKFPVTLKTDYGIFVLDTTKYYVPGEELKMGIGVTGYQVAAEDLDEQVSVGIVSKKSNGLNLYIEDCNVARGKDVLNTMVSLYNRRCQMEKDEMAINTGKFIDERLSIIYNELSASESEIEQYKRQNNLVNMNADVTLMYNQRNEGEHGKMQLNTQREMLKMVKDFINDPANDHSIIPFGVGSAEAGQALTSYNTLVLEYLNLANSAKKSNVALKTLDDQLEVVRKNVRQAVDQTIDRINKQIDLMAKRENAAQSKLGTIPAKERQFLELSRQQSIKNELYTFLLQKREENALVLAATTPKGKIVDEAFAYSEPVAPKKVMVLFAALLFGLMLPIFILYIKSLLTTKFSTQDELEAIAVAPVIGEICHNRHRSSLVVREGKTSSIVELFRLMRNNVQFMLPNENNNVVLLTSSVSGEGKSFVSLNLAASFALLGKKTVLVGMDVRAPKLAEYLSLKPTPGVTSFLSKSDVALAEITQQCKEVDNLDVIVSGPIPPNPSELLLSKRVKQLFGELREKYDCIIIDSAPMAMVSDTFSLLQFADNVVYVSRANYTKRSYIKYLNGIIERGQVKNVSLVLNDSNPKLSAGYGYGYGSSEED